jgi:hypothetical protein
VTPWHARQIDAFSPGKPACGERSVPDGAGTQRANTRAMASTPSENYAARTCAVTDVRAELERETRAMFEPVIAGVAGGAGDADALALGGLLA